MRVRSALVCLALCAAGPIVVMSSPVSSAEAPDRIGAAGQQANCTSGGSGGVDIELVIDQSKSLLGNPNSKPPVANRLPQLREGLEKVGQRLVEASADQDIAVNLGIVSFDTGAREVLPLAPFDQASYDAVVTDLTDGRGLGDYTNYIAAIDTALGLLSAETSNQCKVLLWFTDGRVDLKDVSAADQANLLYDNFCSAKGQGSLSERAEVSQVESYALLLVNPNETLSSNQQTRFDASVHAMQALTGDNLVGEVNIAPLPAICQEYATGDRGGKVLVRPEELAAQLFVLVNNAVGGEDALECPTPLKDGELTTEGLPAGAFIERLDVVPLSGTVSAVEASDGVQTIALRYDATTYQVEPADLAGLPGGWTLRLVGDAANQTEACIQLSQRVLGEVPVIPNTTAQVGAAPITLTVDFGTAFTTIDPGEAIREWSLSTTPTDFGSIEPPTSPGTQSQVTVTPALRKEGSTLSGVDIRVIPAGTDLWQDGLPLKGKLDKAIVVEADANAPSLVCVPAVSISAVGDEVEASSQPLIASGGCTITPPREGEAVATLDVSGVRGGQNVEWVWRDSSGNLIGPSLRLAANGEPITVTLGTKEPLPNENVVANGSATIELVWTPPLQEPQPALKESVPVRVDLKKRADVKEAALIAAIATLVSALLSLVILRLMNARFVRLPEPEQFFVASTSITVGFDQGGNPRWSDKSSFGIDSTQLRPVRSEHPGKDLIAPPLRIERRMPPWWRPFRNPTGEVHGTGLLRAKPANKTSFSTLAVVWTEVPTRPRSGEDIAMTATVLLPKSAGVEFDHRLTNDIEALGFDLLKSMPEPSDPTIDVIGVAGGRPRGDRMPEGGGMPRPGSPPPPPPPRRGSDSSPPAPSRGAGRALDSGVSPPGRGVPGGPTRPAPPPPPRREPPPPPRRP